MFFNYLFGIFFLLAQCNFISIQNGDRQLLTANRMVEIKEMNLHKKKNRKKKHANLVKSKRNADNDRKIERERARGPFF